MKKVLCLIIVIFLFGCHTIEDDIIRSANEVSESTVRLECYHRDIDIKGNEFESVSIGSGVIYKTYGINQFGKRQLNKNRKYLLYEYYVLTNRHVVSESEKITVYLSDFDEYVDADLLACDDKLDIGVVSFKYPKYIKSIKFAETGISKKGSFVFTIGNPDGYLDTLTMGVVSYPNRNISSDTDNDKKIDYVSRYIQIDAAINPGSSGGGLFNTNGELIGINTMKIVDEKIEGIGFAILIDDIKKIIPYLEKGIVPKRIELGITVNDINSLNIIDVNHKYDYGLIITNIKKDSLSEKIGLNINDIIIEVNDKKMKEPEDLLLFSNSIIEKSDYDLSFKIIRNNNIMTLNYIV